MLTQTFQVDTRGRRVLDVTDAVDGFARDAGGDGLGHVVLPHAAAGVALMETESGSEADLEETIDRFLPREDRYRHRHGSTGHGADHLLPVFVPPSLSIPCQGGRLLLGTWQRVVVVDPNRENNTRTVRLTFVPARGDHQRNRLSSAEAGSSEVLAAVVLAVGRRGRGHGLDVAFAEQQELVPRDLHLEADLREEQHAVTLLHVPDVGAHERAVAPYQPLRRGGRGGGDEQAAP